MLMVPPEAVVTSNAVDSEPLPSLLTAPMTPGLTESTRKLRQTRFALLELAGIEKPTLVMVVMFAPLVLDQLIPLEPAVALTAALGPS